MAFNAMSPSSLIPDYPARWDQKLSWATWTVFAVACVSFLSVTLAWHRRGQHKVPSLRDPIPFIFNTVQYLLNNKKFTDRASKVLAAHDIAKFRLFQRTVFLVRGQRHVQAIFSDGHSRGGGVSADGHRKLGTERLFEDIYFPAFYGMPLKDAQRFAQDKSGSARTPVSGQEHVALEDRLWFGYDSLFIEYVGRARGQTMLQPVLQNFCRCFARRLRESEKAYADSSSSSRDEGAGAPFVELSLMDLCRQHVAASNTEALFGSRLFELNPGFMDTFWDLEKVLFLLALGLPRWLYSKHYEKQERLFFMVRKWIDSGWEELDWENPTATEADWEPIFGARINREAVRWIKERGLSDRFCAGSLSMFVFGVNSNSIPTTMWTILEIVKDPKLLQTVRDEIATAWVVDEEDAEVHDPPQRTLDVAKLIRLPVLQSVFAEVLRMHMNFNLLRHVNEPFRLDQHHTLPAGSVVSAPMAVAHYDEADWGAPGHPAAEFWAERHIRYQNEVDCQGKKIGTKRVFALAGRPSAFFPFGGGHHICPGRFLAKKQIFSAVALLLDHFDIESVSWTNIDKSPSDRPAQSDVRYSGTGSMPPDRDLKIRCRPRRPSGIVKIVG